MLIRFLTGPGTFYKIWSLEAVIDELLVYIFHVSGLQKMVLNKVIINVTRSQFGQKNINVSAKIFLFSVLFLIVIPTSFEKSPYETPNYLGPQSIRIESKNLKGASIYINIYVPHIINEIDN